MYLKYIMMLLHTNITSGGNITTNGILDPCPESRTIIAGGFKKRN